MGSAQHIGPVQRRYHPHRDSRRTVDIRRKTSSSGQSDGGCRDREARAHGGAEELEQGGRERWRLKYAGRSALV